MTFLPPSSFPPEALQEIATALEEWFVRGHRALPWRDRYEPYAVWVSEVMLQQTRVDVVVEYFERFMRKFPTVEALAAAPEEEVLSAWSGLGYYRRARMLHEGAREIVSSRGGVIPADVRELQQIRGIGRYTAGAIASIAFDRRAAIVDGNVARVIARLAAIEAPTASKELMTAAWAISGELVARSRSPRMFNQSMMELGALVCTPKEPRCSECPVQRFCTAYREGIVDRIPSPRPRPAQRAMRIHLLVATDGKGRVLLRREEGPLMRGMYHLPHDDDGLLGRTPGAWSRGAVMASFRHTVTFRSIEFVVCEAKVDGAIADNGGEWRWAAPAELVELPHPSYVRKALEIWRKNSEGTL